MSIDIHLLEVGADPVQMVERKGLGHPDTICDTLAENLSRNLCRFYKDNFGLVLHHNVDKGLLFGGRSRPEFGGGEILEALEVTLVGRATMSHKGIDVPVEELAVEGSRQWFRENFRALDPDRHLKIRCLLRPGSEDLTELYLRQAKRGLALANDTSCGVGYAPLNELEQVVLQVERYLNSPAADKRDSPFGEDIKIMGMQCENGIELTVACAMIDRYLKDMDDYLRAKDGLADLVLAKAREITDQKINVAVNTADDPEEESVYLTVTGTSGEAGDDGEVGRGNRVNGLITPYRPMTMEAAAGKNPITHVGKIYNVAARLIAERIVEEVEDVQEAYCYLVSQIGHPVNEPQKTEIKIRVPEKTIPPEISSRIYSITRQTLQETNYLWEQVIEGSLLVY
ncbi:MAG: methionine adenosyltransferase [Desulfurivibrionaceae bacterium]